MVSLTATIMCDIKNRALFNEKRDEPNNKILLCVVGKQHPLVTGRPTCKHT